MPLPPLESVKLFARAGASAIEEPHSIDAFALALRLGATGLQGDVWSTADGAAVLISDGRYGSRLRRRRVADVVSSELGDHGLLVDTLLEQVPGSHELMFDLNDVAGLESLITTIEREGVADRVWLSAGDIDTLVSAKDRLPLLRTVHVTRLETLARGPEQHAAQLRKAGIDAVSLPFEDWSGGHVALFHRFTRTAVARGPVHERQMDELLTMGVDAMVSAHVDRMVDSILHNSTRP